MLANCPKFALCLAFGLPYTYCDWRARWTDGRSFHRALDMDVRILDLDGAVAAQKSSLPAAASYTTSASWGPRIRMACGFGQFRRFEQDLSDIAGRRRGRRAAYDLLRLRRFSSRQPCLGAPAARAVQSAGAGQSSRLDARHTIPPLWNLAASCVAAAAGAADFHVGGEVDFDNSYRWLAPSRELREGRITPFPAYRRFRRGAWAGVDHEPLRSSPSNHVNRKRVEELLRPYRKELAERPLYISFDKDVMAANEAVVNWDSGLLAMSEVGAVLDGFTAAADGRLAGMDVVGDWSPVHVQGWFRQMFHLTEHPPLDIDPDYANHVNQCINLRLLAERGAAAAPGSLLRVG